VALQLINYHCLSRWAFGQSEQIIVPNAVRECPEIFAGWTVDNTDVSTLTADHREKGVRLGFNRGDYLLTGPTPLWATQMRDALVLIGVASLRDASY